MYRRDFLRSALLAYGAAITGCSIPKDVRESDARACGLPRNEILRIDVHCHLMNQDDANGSAFIVRRFIPQNGVVDAAVAGLARTAIAATALGTNAVAAERRIMAELFKPGEAFEPDAFCRAAAKSQKGVFLAGDAASQKVIGLGRITGFMSSRMRNAAVMMAYWPEVDIFMPSMVDFYEVSGGGEGLHPVHQAKFYRDLNLVTHGRFLPLVSFNPERQVKEGPRAGMKQLDLVERAVEEWGFVGVKVHPSAGFNPIENRLYGCPNSAIQVRERLSAVNGIAYDRAMEAIYRLCERLDVPILTHGSDSLSSNEVCMHGTTDPDADPRNARFSADPLKEIVYRDPATWTNSTHHWAEMLNRNGARRNLRVCIAHYASRFQNHLATKPNFAAQVSMDSRRDPLPREDHKKAYELRDPDNRQPNVEYDKDGDLIPSTWLDKAISEIEAGNDRLWLDLSHMVELCYSAASDPRSGVDEIDRDNAFFGSRIDDGGQYARAFRKHLTDHQGLKRQLMYGSDWHMPEVSVIGPSYRELVENVLPEDWKDDVMGRNAARFFGLAKAPDGSKRLTRQRLEHFYEKNGVSEGKVPWMERL